MNYLLDTHTVLWFLNGDKTSLSNTARDIIQKNGFELLPIGASHIVAIEQLPLIHRYPFDRLLIATAITEQMGLVSCDANIKLYPVNTIW